LVVVGLDCGDARRSIASEALGVDHDESRRASLKPRDRVDDAIRQDAIAIV
jgi:hypothetical protein